MATLRKTLFALGILSMSLVFAAILVVDSDLETDDGIMGLRTSHSAQTDRAGELLARDGGSDMLCAILLMPKAYLPLLERFSRQGIAGDVKLLPAELRWQAGKIVAISQHATLRNVHLPMREAEYAHGEATSGDARPSLHTGSRVEKAALLLLLAEAAEKRNTSGDSEH